MKPFYMYVRIVIAVLCCYGGAEALAAVVAIAVGVIQLFTYLL